MLLPLLPSASRLAQSPQAQANQGGNSYSQNGGSPSQNGGAISISPFTPPLPWVTAMAFSERVALSDILPLTSNATLNNSTASNTQSGASGASASAGANINPGSQQSAQQSATGGMNVPLNASGNLVGAKPFSYVNITDLNRQLSQPGVVTVMTVYMADGTTITSFNITNTTNNANSYSGQSNKGELVRSVHVCWWFLALTGHVSGWQLFQLFPCLC